MSRLLLNIDLGERGADHPVDHALLPHADIANLACGGHAGDIHSIAGFTRLAQEHGVRVSAHLSYPDREHFGRKPMQMADHDLINALNEQRQRLAEVDLLKFHGALYHAADTNPDLAETLAAWIQETGFKTVITPNPGALATACQKRGIDILAEAFVERRYQPSATDNRPQLVPRTEPNACLTTVEDAMQQALLLINQRSVLLHPSGKPARLNVDTLCIHSDAPIAEALAATLAAHLARGSATDSAAGLRRDPHTGESP